MADNKTNTLESWMVNLILRNEDTGVLPAAIGDDGLHGSTTAGDLYLSLHTGDPGEGGDQTTSEATYTSYARVAVNRNSDGTADWSQSSAGSASTNNNTITFPTCTGGSNAITHFGIGTSSAGSGALLYFAPLSAPLAISTGIVPQFAAGSLSVAEK